MVVVRHAVETAHSTSDSSRGERTEILAAPTQVLQTHFFLHNLPNSVSRLHRMGARGTHYSTHVGELICGSRRLSARVLIRSSGRSPESWSWSWSFFGLGFLLRGVARWCPAIATELARMTGDPLRKRHKLPRPHSGHPSAPNTPSSPVRRRVPCSPHGPLLLTPCPTIPQSHALSAVADTAAARTPTPHPAAPLTLKPPLRPREPPSSRTATPKTLLTSPQCLSVPPADHCL